jgi:predicted N-acetyltransferase YhbS
MEINIVKPGSEEYQQMIDLRIEALLQPIGIPASYIEPEKEKADLMIGAFEGGRIIGCCVLSKRTDTLVQLRQMAVRPELKGKGIGGAIIRFAEKVAVEKGYEVIMMHARDPVIGFYENCGYQIIGEQFFEVGIGHHRMEKKI